MNYYKNKATGDIIGVTGCWIDLIDSDGNVSIITMVVMPNKWLGCGILWHCMSYFTIKKNYSRTNRKAALEMYPDFGQWRHQNRLENEEINYYAPHYLKELKPLTKIGFGTTHKKQHELCPNGSKVSREAILIYEKKGLLSCVRFLKNELKTDLKTARDIFLSLRRA